MKKVIKYQLSDLKKSIIIFYAIMAAIILFASFQIMNMNNNSPRLVNGTGLTNVFFSFVLGLAMFREHYWMFSQNNISKKIYFKGTLITILITSSIMSFLETAIITLSSLGHDNNNVQNIVQIVYSDYFIDLNKFMSFIICVILSTVLTAMTFISGYLIAAVFNKVEKPFKMLIAIGLPVLAVFGLPFLGIIFPEFFSKLGKILLIILGISSGNPLIAILTISITSCVIAAICYPVVIKSEV